MTVVSSGRAAETLSSGCRYGSPSAAPPQHIGTTHSALPSCALTRQTHQPTPRVAVPGGGEPSRQPAGALGGAAVAGGLR